MLSLEIFLYFNCINCRDFLLLFFIVTNGIYLLVEVFILKVYLKDLPLPIPLTYTPAFKIHERLTPLKTFHFKWWERFWWNMSVLTRDLNNSEWWVELRPAFKASQRQKYVVKCLKCDIQLTLFYFAVRRRRKWGGRKERQAETLVGVIKACGTVNGNSPFESTPN